VSDVLNPAELASLPGLVVLLPLLSAGVLALIRPWRVGAWVNVAVSAVVFLLAALLPFETGHAGPLLLVDGLSAWLALLTAFVGLTTSVFSQTYIRAEIAARRLNRRLLRLYHAMFQVFLGCMLLALLSNNLGVTWVAVEAATISAVLVVGLPRTAEAIEASWKFFIICGVGIALALFGTVVLYLAALPALGPGLPAMTWSALIPAAARMNGTVLNLAFVFLLIGYGTKAALAPLYAWMPDAHAEGPTPVSAVLSGSILNVALFVILRLRMLLDANADAIAPGPPIMALGLLSLLLAAFSLWRRRDVKRFFAFSTIEQSGVAAFAFGVGGPAAIFAGLLHMTLHTLAKAAAFQCVGRAAQLKRGQKFADIGGLLANHRALGLTLAGCVIALAALPPFGLFTSEFLIVSETVRRVPQLSLPLGLGLVVGGWALISRLQGLCLGAPTPDRGPAPTLWSLAPAWLHLAIVLLLGLAMPAPLAAWLHALSGAVAVQ
jgi:hydrogenase-4 component F